MYPPRRGLKACSEVIQNTAYSHAVKLFCVFSVQVALNPSARRWNIADRPEIWLILTSIFLQMIEVDTEMCRYFVTEGLTEDSVSALLHRGQLET